MFDERTGKMLKDRNPEAPPCQVVVQYGPERSEVLREAEQRRGGLQLVR